MPLEGPGKLLHMESHRILIYVSRRLALDSAFPFKRGDDLLIRIEDGRLIIERAP